MSDPGTYAEPPERVEVHETHCSWVFLAGERAYKVKKPVVLPFLDHGTLARRRELCREEVRLNRRLAPALYLGTVALVRRGAGYALVADDANVDDEAIEFAVEMRRFAEKDTLAAQARAGTATERQAERVGHLLAGFHAVARRTRNPAAATDALRAAMHSTLDDLATAPLGVTGGRRVGALRRLLDAVMVAREGQLSARARRGLVCEGHGDLRAEHVILSDPPQVIDCLEFDPALRTTDVAVDLAFLVMDLEALGAGRLAGPLVDAYREAGGDPGDERLLTAFACFRALVRAKVAAVRAEQDGADAATATAHAQRLMALAEQLAWRVRKPLVLVCCGPAASGKTTLAAWLSAQSGLPHLSSDIVRKAIAGIPATTRAPQAAYSPAMTEQTYRALGESTIRALRTHGGAIVDATFRDAAARRTFLRALGDPAAPVLFAECRAPGPVLERRAATRARLAEHVSDATADVVRSQFAAWTPLSEVAARCHLVVPTDQPPDAAADAVLAWIDRRIESRYHHR